MRAAATHVVVIGAGFAGLAVARELADAPRRRPLRVTLVDRRNHHTFQPLLYQVATSGLQLADDPDVYVIGDIAAATDPDGSLLPQLAPVAMQQGRYVAGRLVAAMDGQQTAGRAFRYVDKGTMATIGRHDAVAELPFGIRYGGFPAWVSWLALHLLFLVGFRNRVAVFLSWVWNHLTYDRAARLILHADAPARDPDGAHVDPGL